jgi:hypothetical protein
VPGSGPVDQPQRGEQLPCRCAQVLRSNSAAVGLQGTGPRLMRRWPAPSPVIVFREERLTLVDHNSIYSWRLGGIIYESSQTIVKVARADCLNADGSLEVVPCGPSTNRVESLQASSTSPCNTQHQHDLGSLHQAVRQTLRAGYRFQLQPLLFLIGPVELKQQSNNRGQRAGPAWASELFRSDTNMGVLPWG